MTSSISTGKYKIRLAVGATWTKCQFREIKKYMPQVARSEKNQQQCTRRQGPKRLGLKWDDHKSYKKSLSKRFIYMLCPAYVPALTDYLEHSTRKPLRIYMEIPWESRPMADEQSTQKLYPARCPESLLKALGVTGGVWEKEWMDQKST